LATSGFCFSTATDDVNLVDETREVDVEVSAGGSTSCAAIVAPAGGTGVVVVVFVDTFVDDSNFAEAVADDILNGPPAAVK
jgi:hypothetical protein